ncbi:conserved hypothetical protein [Methanocaldococcus sp. FS406-22]|uniref:hypothetical protein n=1 Tax=Methanocaldococcus sp. (strain FS406-22) TaxID=644281 RepID=UPI0001BF47F9|nr:hypothetical protein [Methanocaldococcus sp. FS406-22]ADC70058.1 conserved hypothetical protein [Methanocaldococcus sp. FS406-22]
MENIFAMIVIIVSVLVSVLLYNSLMKKLNKNSHIKLSDFEVIYRFVIPIGLSFIVMKYSSDFIASEGFSPNSLILYFLGATIVAIFLAIYHLSLNIIIKIFKNKE